MEKKNIIESGRTPGLEKTGKVRVGIDSTKLVTEFDKPKTTDTK